MAGFIETILYIFGAIAITVFDGIRRFHFRCSRAFEDCFDSIYAFYWGLRTKHTGYTVKTQNIPFSDTWDWLWNETEGPCRLIDADIPGDFIWWFAKENDAINFKLRWS